MLLNFRSIDSTLPPEELKTKVLSFKEKANLADFLFDLPNRVQQVEDQLNRQDLKVAAYKASQEGGSI